jgi:hypothetical protein
MNPISHRASLQREPHHEPLCLDPTQVQNALEPSAIVDVETSSLVEVSPAAGSAFPAALEPTQLQNITDASLLMTQPRELPELLDIKGRSRFNKLCLG